MKIFGWWKRKEKKGKSTGENICIDGGMTKLLIYHDDNGWKYEA